MARVMALAKVAQFTMAQEEAVSLQPLIFSTRSTATTNIQQQSLQQAENVTPSLTDVDSSCSAVSIVVNLPADAPVPVQWMVVRFLVSIECFGEATRLCDRLLSGTDVVILDAASTAFTANGTISVNDGGSSSSSDRRSNTVSTSWILAERAKCSLLQLIHKARHEILYKSGICPPLMSTTLRDLTLSEVEVSSVVRQLKASITSTTPTTTAATAATGAGAAGVMDVIVSEHSMILEIAAEVKYYMGLAMWLAGRNSRLRKDKNGCIAFLLESAKLDPSNGTPYSVIGHYYLLELQDRERAAKCYLKALMVDPLDKEAGLGLTVLYLQSGQVEKVKKIWADVMTLTSHAQWCFAVVGQYYLTEGSYESAIAPLQQAVDLWPSDDNSKWSLIAFNGGLIITVMM
jgi:hypothetical protein